MALDFSLNIQSPKKTELDQDVIYDLLIIGAGAAGLNAGIYAKRKGLNVGIIGLSVGGQLLDTTTIENYLGYSSISGAGLSEKFEEHAESLDVLMHLASVKAISVDSESEIKTITLDDDKQYKTKSIIIATGSVPKKLNVKNEEQYAGKGVVYCAICDGPFYRDKDVAVVGGGNTAVESAIDLAKIANKVTLLVRSKLSSDQILIDELNSYTNIEIKYNTEVLEILGDNSLNKVNLIDKAKDEKYELAIDGLFVEIGANPNSHVFKDVVKFNERNEIIVDKYGETNVKGIFAAGDVSDTPYKQVIMAAADGAKCALAASEYVNKFRK